MICSASPARRSHTDVQSWPREPISRAEIAEAAKKKRAERNGQVEDSKKRRIEEIRLKFANGSWRDAGRGAAQGPAREGTTGSENSSTTKIIRCLNFGSRRSLDRALRGPASGDFCWVTLVERARSRIPFDSSLLRFFNEAAVGSCSSTWAVGQTERKSTRQGVLSETETDRGSPALVLTPHDRQRLLRGAEWALSRANTTLTHHRREAIRQRVGRVRSHACGRRPVCPDRRWLALAAS
jgi:hypothetical protein